ncbi:MAG TPA: hypothetical protein VMU97_02495 [Candidatus Dormibacteraeota bacterium]|nr:hypothetical protein [Candidatus Dormibacteraeota bacterium]
MARLGKAASITGIIIGTPVFIVLAFILYGLISNQILRHNLQYEASQLQTPPGCVKNYSYYKAGGWFFGTDDASHLQQEYKCKTTGGVAYDAIVANLTSRGYKVVTDDSLPRHNDLGPDNVGLAYSFIYASKHRTANYDFHPNQPNCCDVNGLIVVQANDLKNIQVTGISLRLE